MTPLKSNVGSLITHYRQKHKSTYKNSKQETNSMNLYQTRKVQNEKSKASTLMRSRLKRNDHSILGRLMK